MAFNGEGTTSFFVELIPTSFRFRVSVAQEKLQIWLEDTSTKQQWSTEYLAMSEYIGPVQAIPDMEPAAYAKRFVECLTHDESQESSMFKRTLSGVRADDTRSLMLVLLAKFASHTASFVYTFKLLPIALDRVDVLEARVRDLEEEIKRSKERDITLITLKTDDDTEPDEPLEWSNDSSSPLPAGFVLHDDGQSIELVRGGRYLICLHLTMGEATKVRILLNKNEGRLLYDESDQRHAALTFVEYVTPNTLLQVTNASTEAGLEASLLTIAAI